jgi:hypothetical protein
MNRLLLISLLLSSGCYADAIRGSGKSAKESRDLPAFDSVEVGSGIHLTVTTGPLQKVLVEADDNVLPLVETRVSDGRLQIGFRRHNLWNSGDVNVTVQQPAFSALDASGGASIDAVLAAAPALSLEASGGGAIVARGLEIKSLTASASGGARLDLAGVADQVKLEFSGGARLKAAKLRARTVQVDGSGGCTGDIEVTELVRGHLSGGCGLHVIGKASSRVATSGGASIDWDD